MKKYILFSMLMAGTAPAAAAMDSDDAYVDSVCRQFDLNEVVVTGTRTPKFLKDTPIQTRVINARELARLDATNVQDLLQQELPGVEFSYAMNQTSPVSEDRVCSFSWTARDWRERRWTTWISPV